MSKALKQISNELNEFLVEFEDFEVQKKIGEGGYGEVFRGIHKNSKKECAIKKLFLTKMKGKELVDFSREVEVLAKCDNKFLLPFYGWTCNPPLLIVTQFIPNGSLYNALRHRKGAPKLNGTQKTLIMIGVAHGMAALHSIGVVHRDLKSLNILLDENLLPKICDFGISRFIDDKREHMTNDIGTPHWMAPEVFGSGSYTNKVDVYSYAILLWEMLAETVPFKGMDGYQIALAVCSKNKRPAIPPNTPRPLKNFIAQCWDKDPNKRPSFEKICKMLKTKNITFPDTDKPAIDMLYRTIKKDEKKRANTPSIKNPPLGAIQSHHKTKRKSNQESEENLSRSDSSKTRGTANFDAITDLKAPNYETNFACCMKEMTPEKALEIFSSMKLMMSQLETKTQFVLSQILEIIKTSQKAFDAFVKSGLFNDLPYQTDATIANLIFSILLCTFSKQPQLLSQAVLHKMNIILPVDPNKYFRIIYCVIKDLEKNSNASIVVDSMLSPEIYQMLDNRKILSTYLKMIHYILQFKQYQSREEHIKIFVSLEKIISAVDSGNSSVEEKIEVLKSCFYIINNFLLDCNLQPIELYTLLQKYPGLNEHIYGYILRFVHNEFTIPQYLESLGIVNQDVVNNLIANAGKSKTAFMILLTVFYMINNFGFTNMSWLDNKECQIGPNETFELILSLICNVIVFNNFMKYEIFYATLVRLLSSNDATLCNYICMLAYRINPDQERFPLMAKTNYFSAIMNAAISLKNIDLINKTLERINILGRTTKIPDFVECIKYIVQCINLPSLAVNAIGALAVLTDDPSACQKAKELNTEEMISRHSETSDQNLKKYLVYLQKNLSKC